MLTDRERTPLLVASTKLEKDEVTIMKKGSRSRKCKCCQQIIFWIVPTESLLGLQICDTKKIRPFRFVKEKPDGSGNYYCMDCLKFMYPDKY